MVIISQPLGAYEYEDNQTSIKTLHYDLDIKVNYQKQKLEAVCQISVLNHTENPVDHIPLELYRLMKVISIKDNLGRDLPFRQQVLACDNEPEFQLNFINVQIKPEIKRNEKRTISVRYEGYLKGYTEVMGYVRDCINPKFTIIREDSRAYPQIGHPSGEGSTWKISQAFTYRIRVTVPESLVVANGGKLIDKKIKDGWVTYLYQNIKPSWRMDIAISKYKVLEEDKIKIFAFTEDGARGEILMKTIKNTLKLYKSWFGPLYEFEGLTFIEIPDDWGSQKDANTIIQTAAAFKDDKRLYEIYHELTHLWNVLPKEKNPPRWEEGLACFLQYLTVEKLEKRPALEESFKRYIRYIKETYTKHPQSRQVAMIDFGKKGITNLSYTVGRIFFEILYNLVGQDTFNHIIGSFYRKYYPLATAEEFFKYLDQQTERDLGQFIKDWIYSNRYVGFIESDYSLSRMIKQY